MSEPEIAFHVNSPESLNALMERVKAAQRTYAGFSQEKVDEIFRATALAAASNRIPLAKAAVEETRMGIVEDKVIKNHFASEYIYNKFHAEKTCGLIEHDAEFGIRKIAEPLGIVAGIIPTTYFSSKNKNSLFGLATSRIHSFVHFIFPITLVL